MERQFKGAHKFSSKVAEKQKRHKTGL